MSDIHPGWDEVMTQIGAKRERERLMDLLDAESITHQERGQIAVRQWARAWIREQGETAAVDEWRSNRESEGWE